MRAFWNVFFYFSALYVLSGCSLSATLDDLRLTPAPSLNSPNVPEELGPDLFASEGFLSYKMSSGTYSEYHSVKLAPDGSIVAAGECDDSSQSRSFCVSKFKADGSLDLDFGVKGHKTVGFYSDFFYGIELQADGKILVYGSSFATSYTRDGLLIRLNSDGSVDKTFAADGYFLYDGGAGEDEFMDVVILSDQSICIGGERTFEDGLILCLNANGTLKTSFAAGGVLALPTTDIFSIAADSNDNLYVVSTIPNADVSLDVRSFNSAGAPNTSFDSDGILTITKVGFDLSPSTLEMDPNGKIVIAGSTGAGQFIYKLNLDGSFDTSYSGDGKVEMLVGDPSDFPYDIAIAPDGSIYWASDHASIQNSYEFAVVKIDPTGVLDTTFDGDGVAHYLPTPGNGSEAYSVLLQADGKILASGVLYSNNNESLLVRFNANGSIDNTFNSGGFHKALGSDWDEAQKIIKLSDGKILFGGIYFDEFGDEGFYLQKININGNPDVTFGANGVMKMIPPSLAPNYTPIGLVELADKSLLVSFGNALYRFTASGVLDSNFDGDGELLPPIPNQNLGVLDLIKLADGRIAGVGVNFAGDLNAVVILLHSNGTLDTSFDADGVKVIDLGFSERGMAIAQMPDGDLIVGIDGSNGTNADFTAVKLDLTGSVDTSWGTAGVFRQDLFVANEYLTSLAVQSDGRVILGGSVNHTNTLLVKLTPAGQLDNTFDADGSVEIDFSGSGDEVFHVSLLPDGKIIASGMASDSTSNLTNSMMIKLNSDGSLDTSFGTNGKLDLAICQNEMYSDDKYILDMIVLDGGDLMVVGALDWQYGMDSFVAKVLASGQMGP